MWESRHTRRAGTSAQILCAARHTSASSAFISSTHEALVADIVLGRPSGVAATSTTDEVAVPGKSSKSASAAAEIATSTSASLCVPPAPSDPISTSRNSSSSSSESTASVVARASYRCWARRSALRCLHIAAATPRPKQHAQAADVVALMRIAQVQSQLKHSSSGVKRESSKHTSESRGGAQGVQRSPTSRTPAGPYGSVLSRSISLHGRRRATRRLVGGEVERRPGRAGRRRTGRSQLLSAPSSLATHVAPFALWTCERRACAGQPPGSCDQCAPKSVQNPHQTLDFSVRH